MTDLNGKVVLVTGSSRGIGAEIAVAFARQGAKVVLHGRDTEALAKIQDDITNRGGHAMSVTGDVTKFADIEAIRARVEQTYGLVDVLVACAGGSGSRPGPIEDIDEESWRADLDANLTATFLTIKSFLPGMKRRALPRSSGRVCSPEHGSSCWSVDQSHAALSQHAHLPQACCPGG
jgi:3-oxoacyl-[acyl-carrier protein] reductase